MKEIVLITGANKGIGLEVARVLGKHGMHVLLGSRDRQRGQSALELLKSEGVEAELVVLDISVENSIRNATKEIAMKHGRLDVLVNNAAVLPEKDREVNNSVESVNMQVLRQTFDTNFFGTFQLTRALLPLLKKSNKGRIVNVSSVLGSLSVSNDPDGGIYESKPFAYSASKAALNMFTVHLAAMMKDQGIRVNSVHPGWVQTDMGGEEAPLSIAEGAKTITDLVLGGGHKTAKFLHLGEELPW